MADHSERNLLDLAADIVSAFVGNNHVQAAELPTLIGTVHSALLNAGNPAPAQAMEKPSPAVPIKKSITPDAIISLIDGKPYRTMKRHLTRHGLTPAQYRERFGLPHDYPMVARSYAAKRSEMARSSGLGQQRQKAAAKTADTSEKVTSEAPAKKRGRKKSA